MHGKMRRISYTAISIVQCIAYTLASPIWGDRVVVLQKKGANVTHGEVHHLFRSAAIYGYAATIRNLEPVLRHPDTLSVQKDTKIKVRGIVEEANVANWGLDRIDQQILPLDQIYHYNVNAGNGSTIYIVDTGINTDHVEFNGRAVWGANFISDVTFDDQGHGTHVAGIAIGASVGVAKQARAVAVKVLDANGDGYASSVIAGLNWIAENGEPNSVINMSMGGDGSLALQQVVAHLIGMNFIICVAAGNESVDACQNSLSCNENVISVAASDTMDDFATFSNFGPNVDLIAPGVAITSAYIGGVNAYYTMSGTSMATPFVSGAIATLKGIRGGTMSIQDISQTLLDTLTSKGLVDSIPPNTPNYLLYTAPMNGM